MWYEPVTNVWPRLEWKYIEIIDKKNAESYIIRRDFTKYLYFTSNKGGIKEG